jgi:hypothetical protein
MNIILIKEALSIACLSLSTPAIDAYATAIDSQSTKLGLDSLITVAVIKHESNCYSGAISDDQFDYGLMQIRAMYYRGPSVNLLNPWVNITVGAHWLQSSKDFCQKQLGREPLTQEYLSCFQGTCKNKKTGQWCEPTPMTNRVEKYAACLQHNIEVDMSEEDCDRIYRYKL